MLTQSHPSCQLTSRRVKRLQTCSTVKVGPVLLRAMLFAITLQIAPAVWPSLSKCTSACRYAHECSAFKSQRRASDSLKLEEVQATVTCPVWVPGTRRGSSGVQFMQPLTHLSSLRAHSSFSFSFNGFCKNKCF